jgi:hypothetical protein
MTRRRGQVMKGLGGSWKPAAMALALAALVVAAAPALAACGRAADTAAPQAPSGAGEVQPVERHGHLGDAIVLSDGGDGQLEATALGLRFMATVATRDSTVSNVYCVKLRLRNVGSTPIHLTAVGANSILYDVGGWGYYSPGDSPRNALDEVDLGPGGSQVGWVYFAALVGGTSNAVGAPGAPNDFQYTVKSSDASTEGDTGQWRWKPIMH